MKILALDTSTDACSVALQIGDELIERFECARERHSFLLLPMVEAVLAQAQLALSQLDALAFGRGPGSFTGLRIGAGVVQGLAFGADLPVAPVSSLAAVAQAAARTHVLALLDARMGQVYAGAFVRASETLRAAESERVLAPEAVRAPVSGGEWWGVGSGWDRYAPILEQALGGALAGWSPGCLPHAREVARLGAAMAARGELVAAEQALPVYLRDDVAKAKAR